MRYIVDILPAALSDIIEAAQWYEDEREGLGADFAAEVDKAIDWLAERALTPRIRYRRKSCALDSSPPLSLSHLLLP